MTITMQEASQQYLDVLSEVGTSERTLYTYGKDFDQILTYFGKERELDSINRQQVGKFLKSDELLTLPNGKSRASATVNKTTGVLKRFLAWAVQAELIKISPFPVSAHKQLPKSY